MDTPEKVAIIMDGNGRWARKRMLPVIAGHRAGFQALKKITSHSQSLGISELTVFAFSSENWQRPADEVSSLMQLFREAIAEESEELQKQNACLRFVGDRSRFSADIQRWMAKAEAESANNVAFQMNIALGYGGRWDLLEATRALLRKGVAADELDEEAYRQHLPSHAIGDVDLLIRTSGEMRISNFLPWQLAYSELHFSDKLWPDFTETDLEQALADYKQRHRRFGKR